MINRGQSAVCAGHHGPVSGVSAHGPEDHAAVRPYGAAEIGGDGTGAGAV